MLRAVRAEAKRNVVAGFAHGAVAFVEIGAESDFFGGLAVGVFSRGLRDFGRSIVAGVTDAHGILSAEGLRLSFAGIFSHQVMVVEFGVPQEKRGYIAIVSGFIFHAFRGRTIAAVEVSRQAGRAGEMRFLRPHVVVCHRKGVGFGEPILVLVAGGFLRIVDGQNHGSEKWWL